MDELISFLSNPKLEVKRLALNHVMGLTANRESSSQLDPHLPTLLPALVKLINDSDLARINTHATPR